MPKEKFGLPTRQNLADTSLEFRQLWVNGRKAIRARQPNSDSMERLLIWDKKNEEAWIPAAMVTTVHDAAAWRWSLIKSGKSPCSG